MAHRSRLLQQVSEKFHKCINYYSTRSVTRVMHTKVYRYLPINDNIGIGTYKMFYCHRQSGRSKSVRNILYLPRWIRDIIMNHNVMLASCLQVL